MSASWVGRKEPELKELEPWRWAIVILRIIPLAVVVFGGLAIHLSVRLLEWPVFGSKRPITPFITQFVCRLSLFVMGIPLIVRGQPMQQKGAVVANHSSWLDIFSLNAAHRVYFVSKAEVAKWPGIGWLARATGTVFINRKAKEARIQKQIFQDRLSYGHKLLFFPEGTSTDTLRVLPFKSTLFAAFFEDAFKNHMSVQAVTVIYHAPRGVDPWFYGWWGGMWFGGHLLSTLSRFRQGSIELVFHDPRSVDQCNNRKELAKLLESDVRSGHPFDGQFEHLT